MLLMALFRRGVGKVLTTITSGPAETVEPRPLHAKKGLLHLVTHSWTHDAIYPRI